MKIKVSAQLRYILLNILYYNASIKNKVIGVRNRVQFLSLHAITPREMPNFRRIVEYLLANYKLVGYSDAVERVLGSDIDDQYIALSFDDGYKSWVETAKLLQDHGIRACFFICPKLINKNADSKTPNTFDWSDAERLLSMGHELGGHTSTHVNLGSIPPSQLEDEVGYCSEELRRRTGEWKHFAWPYGGFAHIRKEAVDYIYKVGHRSCASAVRGAHFAPFDGTHTELCIRRDNIEPRWPLGNVKYFIARNGLHTTDSNKWPESLR